MRTFLVCFLLGLAIPALPARAQAPVTAHKPSLFSETDLRQAWQAAIQANQPMLVMFTSQHCRYCQKMLAETYAHPGVQQLLAGRTQTVLAHSRDYRDLTQKLGVRGYPTSLLISPQGEVLEFMQGYIAPAAFAERVRPLLDAPHGLASAATRVER